MYLNVIYCLLSVLMFNLTSGRSIVSNGSASYFRSKRNINIPITSYGTLEMEPLSLISPNFDSQYSKYVSQGLPDFAKAKNFQVEPVLLDSTVITKDIIGPYSVEVASNYYGVTMLNPNIIFSINDKEEELKMKYKE